MASIVVNASSGVGWTNPSNITASDNVYATNGVAASSTGSILTAEFPAAGIPANATIDGIVIRVERRASSSNSIRAELWNPTKGSSLEPVVYWTTSDAYYDFGGATEKWGATWTPADFNAGFSWRLRARNVYTFGSRTAYIDQVQAIIYYTAPAEPTFTSQPKVSYPWAELTAVGQWTGPASIAFTFTDPDSASVGYTVKKGSSVVKSGSVAPGARAVQIAVDDPFITDGDNTLTLTLDDGDGGVAVSNPFTVRRDATDPEAHDISNDPDPVGEDMTFTITLTPFDAVSNGPGELFYRVFRRTGPSSWGAISGAQGSATSGVPTTTPLIDGSAWLVNGPNDMRITVYDGADNSSFDVFVVTVQLTEPQEIVAGIDGAATVEAAVTAASRVAVEPAGAASVEASVTAAALIAPVVAGEALVDVPASAPAGIEAAIFGGAWVSIRLLPAAYLSADMVAWASVNAFVHVRRLLGVDVAGAATVASGLSAPAGLVVGIAGVATVEARAALVPEIAVEIAGVAAVAAEVSFRADLVVSIAGRAVVAAALQEYQTPGGYGLRADLFDVDGEPLASGPLMDILGAEYEAGLDEVGAFSLAIPAADPAAAGVADGVRLNLYRAGEGLVFRGVIGASDVIVTPDGQDVMTISGDSLARELVWKSTMIGTDYDNEPLPAVVGDLLGGTGWTSYGVASDSRNVTAQYTGLSRWQALVKAAELYGWHVRERNLTRQVEVGPLGGSSGLVLSNVAVLEPSGDTAVKPVAWLRITDRQDELWNQVAPLGGGEGINALTLEYSDRTGPYPIHEATGRNGEPYWYVEDAASIAVYGARERVLNAKELVPLSNSPAEIRNAANTLYDVAAAWLGWHGQVQESYSVDALGLRHIVGGQVRVRVGDRLRLRFRGVAEDEASGSGRRVWRDIDRDVWLLGYKRSFAEDGTDRWTLAVSTVDRETPSDDEVIARALEDLWAVQTAKRPYTFVETIGPYVESVAAGSTARVPVVLDRDVTWLHRATLRVRKRRVKSNVTGAAAGGGQTATATTVVVSAGGGVTSDSAPSHSHAITAATTPSGGGHTSESGGPHTHLVIPESTFQSGFHWHHMGNAHPTESWSDPGWRQQLRFENAAGLEFGFYVGRGGTQGGIEGLYTRQGGGHIHTIPSVTSQSESSHKHAVLHHSHSVSGQTAIASGSHSHSLPTHTHATSPHSHEIKDHTHALLYGVFLGPHPSAPQITVTINGTSRTAALGGPWDNDFTVDITQYLVDGQGQPLRQSNSIEIGSAQLMDAEVVVRLMASTTSVVPVG